MSSAHPPGWSAQAAATAWFAAWWRAAHSGVPGSADVVAAELRALRVEVAMTVKP